jgi:fructose-1-phosphate kinase PfkB-like protein
VITVTLNPSIDRTLWVEGFRGGATFLAERSEDYAGGKGVNTSRALLRMGAPSTATGILGARGGRFYRDILEREGLAHRFLTCEGRVRTNVTVLSGRGVPETHIRDRGQAPPAETAEQFLHLLDTILAGPAPQGREPRIKPGPDAPTHPPTVVVLSGSLPEGFPSATYAKIIERIRANSALAYFDASGEPLRLGLESQPSFIKPNRHEVREALGFLPRSEKDCLQAVSAFHAMKIPLVMVSRGVEGLVLSDGKEAVSAKTPVEEPVNSVGSGDAAVAGAVLGLLERLCLEETARLACAMGGANTLLPGGGALEKEQVLRLSRMTRVKRL